MSESSHDMIPRSGLRGLTAQVSAWAGTPAGARWLLALILLVGAYLRLNHLNWDMGAHIHPDERFLTMVESALQLPKNLGEFFDSTQSPMNPYNKGYGFFVYGTLPIFIVKVVSVAADKLNQTALLWTSGPGVPLNLAGYDGVHLVGRALSGLFDLAGVWLIYVIGKRLYSRKVGLLAAALLAFAVLPLQQSHFFTADTFGTFFALLTFYFAVRVAQGGGQEARGKWQGDGGWISYLALGASLGASLACRINLAPLAGIALLAAGIRLWDDWHDGSAGARERGSRGVEGQRSRGDGAWLATLLQATLFRLLLMTIVAVAVFRVAQPYAFGGTSLLDFSLSKQWQDNMRQIRQLIGGDADTPPGHQWASRTPFVFPFGNMVVWGMGLPMGLAAWAGWALAAWQLLRGLTTKYGGRMVRAHLLPVVWIGGMFLWQGLQFVQSMRYYLPLYPIYALMAAWVLWWVVEKAQKIKKSANQQIADGKLRIAYRVSRIAPQAAYALLALVVVGTMLWGWGFLAIYRRPLTRVTASRWMYQNVAPGSHIGNEHWDDGLPLRIEGKDGFGSFGLKGLSSSSDNNMQMYWEDTPEKREQLYQWLNEADYLVLSSNRLWGSIPRLPLRYPMTTLYYQLLFAEKLGFEQALHVTSFPTIFGIQFNDTKAEEAFSVYDHPEVYIFKKTPGYSEGLVRSYLDAVDLEFTIQMWPKQVSAARGALMLTDEETVQQQAGGTWSRIFNLDGLVNRWPGMSVIAWLLLLELLGVVAFPIAFVALRGLSDRGYGVSKTLGVLLLAWLSWIGPSLKLVPYDRWWIAAALGLLIGAGAAVGWRRRAGLAAFVRERRGLLLTEGTLFLGLFAMFLLIRWGNPDLWHPARGGEKPMDFAYLNAVIKSTTFPPYDPWHAGGFLSYYYFGFVIVGTLIKLTGIVPWVAYNLVVPTLFALTGLGAFSVAYSLADGDRATEFPGEVGPSAGGMRVGPLLAGLAGAFFVAIAGNFGNLKLILDQLAARSTLPPGAGLLGLGALRRSLDGLWSVITGSQTLQFPNDWWFWNASRVIPDTINEFPFFTFTYADLHAHMIALPLTLLGLAIAVALVRHGYWVSGIRYSRGSANTQSPIPNTQHPIPNTQYPIPGIEPSPWRISLPDLLPIVLLGLVVGALRATNTWDFPTYILVGLTALAVLEVARRCRMPFPEALDERLAFLFRAAVSVLWRTVILVAVASLTFYPYTKYYATQYAGLQRWKDATTSLSDYLTVWGFFLAVTVIYLLSELGAQIANRKSQIANDGSFIFGPSSLSYIVGATIVILAAGLALKAQVWLIALPLFVLAAVLAFGSDIPSTRRLGLLLIALALAITMGVEVVRQKDDIGRMNTVFKFYLQAWTLLGVGAAVGLGTWAARAMSWRPSWRRLAWGVTALLFLGVMLYPGLAARAKVLDRFSKEASPHGLDGIAYMDQAQYSDNNRDLRLADDKAAILWMLENVEGSPVILEGNSPGYRWGSRFSIYTGLPAVQGWDWHQKQQRSVVPGTEIDRRLGHVREMYDTTDLRRAQYLLDHYGVAYVIVGELERAYYSAEGLAKFDTLTGQGYLEVAYEGGTVRIYEVVGRAAPVAVAPAVAPSPKAPQAGTLKAEPPVPPEATLPAAQPFESPAK
ncbi:MAG: hypothetical protein CVU38_04470 [Chloroflexi bacterium HGW-Chloroflexi-1]|nr:MAG: hypothetical protein CVU38_04470 [Chloroflexi bacterium HGW-Chloroflexi-1]